MSLPIIGFAGLTHLGLISAVSTASKGFHVVGYDTDPERVNAIRAGRFPVVEPDLDNVAETHKTNLVYSNHVDDLAQCDIVYIATDVPTDDRGQSDLTGISDLIKSVLPALGPKALLVVLCQVPPGFTRTLPLAADRLFYQVETLVFGRAIERAVKPERFIVGCAEPDKSLPISYKTLLATFDCPVLTMRYESAELAKIAINCCLVASVSVANTLAELSEGIGADWNEIVPALRLDRRIGAYSYLVPGLGIAGGNLERDLATVMRLSEASGSDASVIAAFLHNSHHRRYWALRVLHQEVLAKKQNATLGVLGLAYKENTHSTKNSPSLALISHLLSWPLRVYDPVVQASVVQHPSITAASSALDSARGADALLIMTPWPEFRKLSPHDLISVMVGKTVIDPYRILDPAETRAAGMRHFCLGAPVQER